MNIESDIKDVHVEEQFPALSEVARRFEGRAKRARRMGHVVALLIVVLVFSSTFVFYVAGEVATRERLEEFDETEAIDELIEEARTAQSEARNIVRQLVRNLKLDADSVLREQIEAENLSPPLRWDYEYHARSGVVFVPVSPREAKYSTVEKRRLSRMASDFVERAAPEGLRELRVAAREAVEYDEMLGDLRKQRVELRKAINESRWLSDSGYFLVHTNLTRFGSIAVILFLVNVLLGVYRYLLRLAAYYDARADAAFLLAHGHEVPAIGALVGSLSPDGLDFGKMPLSPSDHMFEIAKGIANRASGQR